MNRRLLTTLFLFPALALSACSRTPAPAPAPAPATASEHKAITTEKLEPYSCGTIQRLHTFQGIFLASQPAADDLRQAQKGGVKTVINLRPESEIKEFDEPKLVGELGLHYVNIPFAAPAELTDAVFAKARETLFQAEKPILLHCHSGNRVGAIWLAHRVLDDGLAYDAALAEAKEVGLKAPALEARAKEYIDAEHAPKR